MLAGPTKGLDRHPFVRLPLTRDGAGTRVWVTPKSRRQRMEKTMRGRHLLLTCGLLALISICYPALATSQETKGRIAGWSSNVIGENFKKICTWVKVCR